MAYDSIEIIDFSVIETVRSRSKQNEYFIRGFSHIQWPESKHNICDDRPLPEAMDLWPFIRPYGALSGHPSQIKKISFLTNESEEKVKEFIFKSFSRLAGVIQACAHSRGHDIRWGGDWDGDFDLMDQKFNDLPHFELVRN